MKLLYATSNPGKQEEVKKLLSRFNIALLFPHDLELSLDPDESGKSLEENAGIKAREYVQALNNPEIIVMTDDTGVEIDALGGEPGIHVRRWKGYRMEDEEIITYCLDRMRNIDPANRKAQFRTVIALAYPLEQTYFFEGVLGGTIAQSPIPLRMKGFPFESIFYIPEYKKMLGEIHQMNSREKDSRGFHSHREKAVINALPKIKQLLS